MKTNENKILSKSDKFNQNTTKTEENMVDAMEEEPIDVEPTKELQPVIADSQSNISKPNNERLVISNIENINFKSYAGKQVLGPFHKVGHLKDS